MRKHDDKTGSRCIRAIGAAVVVWLFAGQASGQDELAGRIAQQRERVGLESAGGAADETRPAAFSMDEDAADLPRIPAPVDPAELLPLGPAPVDAQAPSARPPAGGWLMDTLAALGVVIGLIFLLRWGLRKWGGANVGGGVRVAASPVVEVLSRTTVAPRSHVVLLRVGPKVLIVNDGAAGMRTLATVDDPDEVAGLLQSIEVAHESSLSNSFGRAMTKLSGSWSPSESAGELGQDDSEAGVDQARGALAGLRDRLRLSSGGRGGAS